MANDHTENALDVQNVVSTAGGGTEHSKESKDSLLEMDEKKAARQALKDWDDSWKEIKPFSEQWKVNRARSQGFTGVQLVKRQDQSQAHIPLNAKRSVAGMNKAARLKRRLRSVMFSDPPVAEATPATDEDQDRDAAETATRVLQDACSEGNLDYALAAGDAFDLAGDYGSGFLRIWVDETGGGWEPKQIEAAPNAVSAEDPLPVDPQTGLQPKVNPILRYVTEGGEFTEEPREAEKTWLPKLKREVLTGKHVRFIPFNVRDIWEADGVMVGAAIPLGTLKNMFPELEKWPDDRIATLVTTRPQHFKELLPVWSKETGDTVSDKAMVFVLTRYHVQSLRYPEGAYLLVAGKEEMLFRSNW